MSFQNQGYIDVIVVVFAEAFPNDDQSLSNTIYLLFMNEFGVGLMLRPILILFENENSN